MRTSAWARSGARPSRSGARPAGSWAASIARAKAAWDGLTGWDGLRYGQRVGYSETAAAAILSTALGLWSDTAAALGGDDGDSLDETANMGTD